MYSTYVSFLVWIWTPDKVKLAQCTARFMFLSWQTLKLLRARTSSVHIECHCQPDPSPWSYQPNLGPARCPRGALLGDLRTGIVCQTRHAFWYIHIRSPSWLYKQGGSVICMLMKVCTSIELCILVLFRECVINLLIVEVNEWINPLHWLTDWSK